MEVLEYKWFKDNFNNLTEDEQKKSIQLGIKSWLDSPTGEVNMPAHDFIKAMRYLDKLYKKYNK